MEIDKPVDHPLKIQSSEIHIWKGDVDAVLISEQTLRDTLSIDEIERSEKFKFTRDQRRFLHRRYHLRKLLAFYLDCSPADLEFSFGPHGKPYLNDFSQLNFNLSHTQGRMLVGCTLDHEIGVDLECINDQVDCLQIASRFFSEKETNQLKLYQGTQQTRAFFYIWTRKEAFIKADGRGLQIPLDSFDVELEPKNIPDLTIHDPAFTHLQGNLYNLHWDENYLGASYVIGSPLQHISFFDL
jgi:4'-phosphopantetheinyl transferase